jgi:predicted nuclease of predicted toxin-antitoxin system
VEKVEPRLFVVLYLDEDVDVDLVPPLRREEYEVYCVRDVGTRQRDDPEQLTFAAERGWTILTHNVKDFRRWHSQWMAEGKEHAGIIVSKRMEIGRMLRALLNLLDRVSADEMRNQLLYLQNFE